MKRFKLNINKSSAYLVLLAGVMFSILVSFYTYQTQVERERVRFEITVNQMTLLVQNRMDAYKQVLLGGAGLFYTLEKATRDDWRQFVSAQKIETTFPGIQGVGYSVVVRAFEKDAHVNALRKEGFVNYDIKPDGQRELYTSIIYLEPFNDRNKRAFGYDMFSEKVRNEAMSRAIDSGEPAMSGKVRLKQENSINEQSGFLIYVPVYKAGALINTKEERFAAIQGFVYAPFRVNDLMNGVIGNRVSAIDFEIYDGDAIGEKSLLFDSHPEFKGATSALTSQTKLTIGGRNWVLCFSALKSFADEADGNKHSIILVGGLLLSLAMFALMQSLIVMRQRAEEIAQEMTAKLSASEERLRYALEGAGDGLWDWNMKTDEIYFSKRWKEMLGFREDELRATLDEWKSRVHPDDLEQVYTDTTEHIEGKKDVYINEHRVKCKDGSYKWVLARGMIVARDNDGSPVRMVGSHTDITDKKAAELALREERNFVNMILDTAGSIMAVIDKNGSMIKFNKYAQDFTGYAKDEIVGPMEWTKLLKPEQHSGVDELFALAKEGKIKHRYENYWVAKSGETRLFDWFNSIITDEQGKMTHLVTVGVDITERVRLEEDLRSINRHLNEMVKAETQKSLQKEKLLIQQSKMAMMGEMIGAIAHQWRQPLNSLGLIVQDVPLAYMFGELNEKYLDDFKNNAMSKISNMSATMEDFKNFFSPNKKAEQFFLEDAINETLQILGSQLAVHGIQVLFSNEKTNKHQYVCYKNELKQVLLNILANAKDALFEKKPKNPFIKIDIAQNDAGLAIVIEDSAGGIPDEIIDKVFDSYFTTKEEGKGTGIGLYMSKQIVEESLHGRLSVSNSENGAKFVVELP